MRRTELRRLRKALGFSQLTLAQAVGCTDQSVKRWESGENDVSAEYRQPLATALKVSLTQLESILNGGTTETKLTSGWWSNYETYEQSATHIRTWEPILVPGLLQTREYAAAILKDEDLLARRMHRQTLIPRIELDAVIDESVLLRPVGGRYVLAGQLRHLVDMNQLRNVSVQVLPLDSSSHPADWGSFTILEMPWPGGMVALQHKGGSHSLDSAHDIANHGELFDRLQSLALSADDTNKLLTRRGKELAS